MGATQEVNVIFDGLVSLKKNLNKFPGKNFDVVPIPRDIETN